MTSPTTYFTPVVRIDGVELAFAGELAAGKESELFATLLTHATFEVRGPQVVHEAYERAHARMDEERWYALAKEYFDEYRALIERGDARALKAHLAWLDEHFFKRHPALGLLRAELSTLVHLREQQGVTRDPQAADAPARALVQEARVLH